MDTTASEFMEHFHKTGKCFICQGEVSNFKSIPGSNINNNHRRKVALSSRRFRTLASRYLNLQNNGQSGKRNWKSDKDNCDIVEDDEGEVTETMKLTEIFKDNQNETKDHNHRQLSVTCEVCFPFLDSFCQIYGHWAYLQLQLNWRLKQISVLMMRRRRKKQPEVEKSNFNLTDPNQMRFRERFLSRLKDKSSPRDFPHLKLDRLKPEEIDLSLNKRKDNFTVESSELKNALLEDEKSTSEFLSSNTNNFDYDHNQEIEHDSSEANEIQVESETTTKNDCNMDYMGNEDTIVIRNFDIGENVHVANQTSTSGSTARNVLQSQSIGKNGGNPTHRNYKSPHKCQFCRKKFSSAKEHDLHVKVHLSSTRPFQCFYCAMTFAKADQRLRHEKMHLEDRPFRCGFCHLDFLQATNCRLHQKRVHNIKDGKGPIIQRKPVGATCSICKKSFASLFSLKQHKILHTGEKRFKCNFCDKGFSRNEHRQTHERTNHLGRSKPFVCKLCDMSFGQTTFLYSHVLANHKMDKTQYKKLDPSLTRRNKKFLNNDGEKKLKNKRRRRQYRCRYCPEIFFIMGQRHLHERTHRDSPRFKCGICGREFTDTAKCKRHLKLIHKMQDGPIEVARRDNPLLRSLLDSEPGPTKFSLNVNNINVEVEAKETKMEIHQQEINQVHADEMHFEASEEFVAKREPESRNFFNNDEIYSISDSILPN